MADADEDPTVAERLGRLLDRGLLPAGGPAEAAERLIERLQRPARVALLGLPGSGKSAILNLLAGKIVVPESLRLPTIIVQHSDEPKMQCTLADGQIVTVPGTDLEKVLVLSPALITLELALPALNVISLLEVAAGPMEAEQRRAALWAGKRADILIWCSTAYLPKEQLVWEGMPEAYKDNGFLLLTKVDLLGGREAATGMHQRVMQRATGEFRHVLPISAKDARSAATEGKPIDRDRFRESGAATVIATIKSRIQQARQADMDTAELLLARHAEVIETPQRPKYELRAVENLTSAELTEEALAAESAALERIAAAAFQATAPDPQAVGQALPDPAVDLSAQEPVAVNAEIELFPEPEGIVDEIDEPTPPPEVPEESLVQSLRAILGDPSAPPTELVEEPLASVEAQEPERNEIDLTQELPSKIKEAEAQTINRKTAPEGPETSPRFAARLKQISTGPDETPTELVPLRATWKSRTDMVSGMPIVPKPEPNRNPTPRQLPEGAGSARLVGRALRSADPQANSGEGVEADDGHLTESAATANTDAADTTEQAEPPDSSSAIALESRSGPVFAPDSQIDLPPESAAEGMVAVPQAAVASDSGAVAKADPPPPSEAELTPDRLTPAPEAESPTVGERGSLSERLRRPTAPVSVTRVTRLATPMPSPQDIVALRMDASRGNSADGLMVERRERPRIAPRALPTAPLPAVPEIAIPTSEKNLLDQGIGIIAARSVELYDQVDPDEKPPLDLILDHVGETVDQVLAILLHGPSPQIRRISTSFGEVQDLIMLMQLEKGRAPADDALTLLLQLRREMETLRVV